MLTKADELKILQSAISKLGDQSYLGPALSKLLPFAEREMRSDIEPDLVGALDCMQADVARYEDQRRELAARLRELEDALTQRRAALDHAEQALASARDRLQGMAHSLLQVAGR